MLNTRMLLYLGVAFLILVVLAWKVNDVRSRTFSVDDVTKRERFSLKKRRNFKPLNVNYHLTSHTDSAFRITVWGIPGGNVLFDSLYQGGPVEQASKLDFYRGYGIKVDYSPKGIKQGEVTVQVRLNADF